MTRAFKEFTVKDLFVVQSGDFHALKELAPGNTPLISCGDEANGVVGYYDIPPGKVYRRRVTVAYNGSWPLMSKYHPYDFGAKDDVAVLVPRSPLSDGTLLYVAASLDRMVWRFHYGRKCFREKLLTITLPLPVVKLNGDDVLDEGYMDGLLIRAKTRVTEDVTKSATALV